MTDYPKIESDLFKLIFEHDLRLDQLRERKLDRSSQDVSSSIEDFMKPDPTYSKFYITGTRLDGPSFGLNVLNNYPNLIDCLNSSFSDYTIFVNNGRTNFVEALETLKIGSPVILSKRDYCSHDLSPLHINDGNNVGHFKSILADVLKSGDLVLYKEKAHDGFDLHLFSKKNVYHKLFYPIQKLVSPNFRFFSINGKRIRSERKFYFETWTLNRPPHGAEEVFSDTIL